MINSAFFFIRFAFILREANHYRLVAIEDKHKIIDVNYKTFKGAKIACAKILRKHVKKKGMKPVWSFLYPPDEKWLKDKLNRKNGQPGKTVKDTTISLQQPPKAFGLEPTVTL